MTALPSADLSDAEALTLARIEATPEAEESIRETLAAALYEETEAAEYTELPDAAPRVQQYVYRLADAALDVLRGPSTCTTCGEAQAAIERVEALAERYEGWGGYLRLEPIAADLRAALDGTR